MLSIIKAPTGGAKLMAAVILALATGLTALLVSAEPASANLFKMTHAQVKSNFDAAGIKVYSSATPTCFDPSKSNCTGLKGMNNHTVYGIKTFKKASGCAITVTGGTETGHASGTYSHANGYKVDISPNSCVNGYIKRNFRYIGGSKYKSSAGNIYYNEGNHWDITYYNVH